MLSLFHLLSTLFKPTHHLSFLILKLPCCSNNINLKVYILQMCCGILVLNDKFVFFFLNFIFYGNRNLLSPCIILHCANYEALELLPALLLFGYVPAVAQFWLASHITHSSFTFRGVSHTLPDSL